MAKVASFEEMALEGLRDIYDAEHQVLGALPELMEAATSPKLKKAFETHRKQTEGQVARLEQVFQGMGVEAERKHCPAAAGLLKEGRELIKEIERGPLLDAALIGAAQKFEHYEIAAYGTARTFAEQHGDQNAVKLLEETLDEEKQTDQLLTDLAVSTINEKAEAQQ